MFRYDVLVIGSGGTGLRAALAASEQGLRVGVLTKTFPVRAATVCAQGGINGALGNVDGSDSRARHAQDTLDGSYQLADRNAVEFFVEQAMVRINELAYWGLPFSRDVQGKIAQRPFGGGSFPRTCFAQDRTGQALLHTLFEQCLKHKVEFLSEWLLLDIIAEKRLCGVIAMDLKQGKIMPLAAKAVVIATGGAGRMYSSRTTNPYSSTGDGIAACFRVGIPIKDPEFIQFHPTGLVESGILISEAARGEGGYLVNRQGERFMYHYDPRGELATRDVIARAIETEIAEGLGWGDDLASYVQLDVRHLGREKIKQTMPQIAKIAWDFARIDLTQQPVPVRPTCHYFMGGIDVRDYSTCATKLEGLFAAGECACISIHGANRLGGNSLAETVVFGEAAGRAAADFAVQHDLLGTTAMPEKAKEWEALFFDHTQRMTGRKIAEVRLDLAKTMWEQVGVFRTESSLQKALRRVQELQQEYITCHIGDQNKIYNTAFVQYIELGNMLTVAETVIIGAIARKESRGGHFRRDYPQLQNDSFLCHTIINPDKTVTYQSVGGRVHDSSAGRSGTV